MGGIARADDGGVAVGMAERVTQDQLGALHAIGKDFIEPRAGPYVVKRRSLDLGVGAAMGDAAADDDARSGLAPTRNRTGNRTGSARMCLVISRSCSLSYGTPMVIPRLLAACLLLAATVCPQESRSSRPSAAGQVIHRGRYDFVAPSGWRQLTPMEARTLQPKLPADMRKSLPVPGEFDRFGRIDDWLRGEFDGRCLTTFVKSGEPSLTAETLAEVRTQIADRSTRSGFDYTLVSAKQTTVGVASHPAFEVVVGIAASGGGKPMRALEIYAPTGGRTVFLEFRAFESDFPAALPEFRKVIATLVFAREPRGPANLSDRLQNAAIVGAIVGLVLLVLYKWTRR